MARAAAGRIGGLEAQGAIVARVLSGAWRSEMPPLELSEPELATASPLLLRTAGASLAWRRVRDTPLVETAAAQELHEGSRLHRLEAGLRERDLATALAALQAQDIRPLLVRGWTLARYYPERGLRPYGDLDLYVRPDERAAAAAALAGVQLECEVDLHSSHNFPFDRSLEDLRERAERLELEGVEVIVPCAEDHLRLLCLHMLYHGVWRPVWLCDIATMLEALPEGFDWDRLLHGRPRYTEWVKASLGLAARVLQARLPAELESDALPSPWWLDPTVLRQWGRAAGGSAKDSLGPSLLPLLRHPHLLSRELQAHWQNGVEATIDLGGPFNELPRLPFQLAAAVRRIPRLVARRDSLD